jgi:hypothetical protein
MERAVEAMQEQFVLHYDALAIGITMLGIGLGVSAFGVLAAPTTPLVPSPLFDLCPALCHASAKVFASLMVHRPAALVRTSCGNIDHDHGFQSWPPHSVPIAVPCEGGSAQQVLSRLRAKAVE